MLGVQRIIKTVRSEPASQGIKVPWPEALRLWLKIGCLGFGGPSGQIALLHRETVEQRGWIGE